MIMTRFLCSIPLIYIKKKKCEEGMVKISQQLQAHNHIMLHMAG